MNSHLPHGFNTLLEKVEVTVSCQVAGPYHVTIETPELFNLVRNERSKLACNNSFGLCLDKILSMLYTFSKEVVRVNTPRRSCQSA